MTETLERIDRDMGSAVSLLHPIALLNKSDKESQQVYFDTENGCAICGFRRTVANYGVLLVRAQYGRGAEITIPDFEEKHLKRNGVYHYTKKSFKETNEGILGKEKDGVREPVNNESALEKINHIRNLVELRYEVDLSPNDIHNWITARFKGFPHGTAYNYRKINMQFTAGIPAGTNLAIAERQNNGDIIMVSEFTINGNKKLIKSYVDKHSAMSVRSIVPGRVYLIKPGLFNKETGERTCNVLRTYVTGIRMAVQHFERGLFRPGTGSYDVNPSNTNGIKPNMVLQHNFMTSQNDKMKFIVGAPMVSFDLDMFAALMNTLRGYPVVTMKFRDASSGAYFFAKGYDEYHPDIEAICGQTIQYVRGRVWTP